MLMLKNVRYLEEERKKREVQSEKNLKFNMFISTFLTIALFHTSFLFLKGYYGLGQLGILMLAGMVGAFLINWRVGVAIAICQQGSYFAAIYMYVTVDHVPLDSRHLMLKTAVAMLAFSYMMVRKGARHVEGVGEKKARLIILLGNGCILLINLGVGAFLTWG